MKIRSLAACAVMIALAVAGCTRNTDNTVIAKVNNGSITAADFKKQLEDLQPQMAQAVAMDPKARKDFLEDLVGIELVLQEAKRQKLDKDPDFKRRQDERRKLVEQRLQDEAKNELFNALLKKELLEKIKPPTDDEVLAYYTSHRDEIRKAAGGKNLSLKQAVDQGLKRYVLQIKQREAYLEYAKGLKAKAKIVVDDKALDALVSSLVATAPAGAVKGTPPPAKEEKKSDETKK